jgi:hypothetical protein
MTRKLTAAEVVWKRALSEQHRQQRTRRIRRTSKHPRQLPVKPARRDDAGPGGAS